MTEQELLEKYGELELSFSSYYKFSFSYSTKKDGIDFYGSYGECADDIYKENVSHDSKVKVKCFKSHLSSLYVKKDDEVLFEFRDF